MLESIDLILAREILLLRFLGISPKVIFNSSQDAHFANDGISLVTHLKQVINSIQAQAIADDGKTVDYTNLAKSKIYQEFRSDLTPQLRYFDPQTLQTSAERFVFWINLYNILVIDSVIQLNVQTSITEGFAGVLRFFRQAAYEIGGYRTSLEDIEHGILRANRGNPFIPGAQFGVKDPRKHWVLTPMDPRIHFALNCASKSCPPIAIYSVEGIDSQLDLATMNFINQEVRYDPETNTLNLSSIFQWFTVDFGGRIGVQNFIKKYLPEDKVHLLTGKPESLHVKFNNYDWGLNLKKSP